MFTGIVQAVGRIEAIERSHEGARLRFGTGALDLEGAHIGDSIAVNGVCLTATALDSRSFSADLSRETLSCTTFASAVTGQSVNLEKALTLATPLGGHLVSGHVDGVGRLLERRDEPKGTALRVEAPEALARYIACKGSITVDGVSLTVNGVEGACFDLFLVPHTLSATTLESLRPGDSLNLEVDLVARYVERLLTADDHLDPSFRSGRVRAGLPS